MRRGKDLEKDQVNVRPSLEDIRHKISLINTPDQLRTKSELSLTQADHQVIRDEMIANESNATLILELKNILLIGNYYLITQSAHKLARQLGIVNPMDRDELELSFSNSATRAIETYRPRSEWLCGSWIKAYLAGYAASRIHQHTIRLERSKKGRRYNSSAVAEETVPIESTLVLNEKMLAVVGQYEQVYQAETQRHALALAIAFADHNTQVIEQICIELDITEVIAKALAKQARGKLLSLSNIKDRKIPD